MMEPLSVSFYHTSFMDQYNVVRW